MSGENKQAGRDGAHQLYALPHINSFSCLGITPQIDWFYLPVLPGRVWKWEKSVLHLFIILFSCFSPFSAKILFIFLFCLVPALKAWGCCFWPLHRETPNPRSHVSLLWFFWGAGCEGKRVTSRIPNTPNCHPLPAALEAKEILLYFVIADLQNLRLCLFFSVVFLFAYGINQLKLFKLRNKTYCVPRKKYIC